MITKITANNVAVCECSNSYCKNIFKFQLPPKDSLGYSMMVEIANNSQCENCIKKMENQRKFDSQENREIADQVLFDNANIPRKMQNISAAFNSNIANWIQKNKHEHLLLTGITGTGKTTSVCINATRLLKQGVKIKFYSAREFFAEYSRSKSFDYDPNGFFRKVFKNNILILDEFDKVKVSETIEEAIFEIFNKCYEDGRCKVWIAGNISNKRFAEMISTPMTLSTIQRRIKETFKTLPAEFKTVEKTA